MVNSTVLEVRVPAFKFSGRFNVPGIRAQNAYASAHREREVVEALDSQFGADGQRHHGYRDVRGEVVAGARSIPRDVAEKLLDLVSVVP